MDFALVTQLFRQLFRHPACQSRQNVVKLARTLQDAQRISLQQRRAATGGRVRGAQAKQTKEEPLWQPRTAVMATDKMEEYQEYPMVTANELRKRPERPRKVRMLMRDFIEDSLYNPHYGYFSKQAVIFTPGEPFEFGQMRDDIEFHNTLSRRYKEFEDRLDEDDPLDTRQLWYTPTELFRPYYGDALARYLVERYLTLNSLWSMQPGEDLIIYEMGAGRGTLMLNILDWTRDAHPEVYARTQYRIIEISGQLAAMQQQQLSTTAAARGHADKVEVINRSIFDWNELVRSPCFFLAFEVFDNLAHDVVRYDLKTKQPLQGVVLIDGQGDFFEFYKPELDPVASRFLEMREAATQVDYTLPYARSRLAGWWSRNKPFAHNLSQPEYLPTRLMQFFEVLAEYFPSHWLLTSDFHHLPDATPGINAPIVQTRYQRRPIPVTTPLVHQGYFDIMFPTNFEVASAMYQAITTKHTHVQSHKDFMKRWAYVEDTETRSGENPLLSWYKNASVMYTR